MTVVGVLDYGSGNLHSVCRALDALGATVKVSSVSAELADVPGLVVPGVGAFSACMAGLVAAGGDKLIRDRLDAGKGVLGICVGHQVMFERGVEHGEQTAGLGLLPGTVEPLAARRVPHMGWNLVEPPVRSQMFAGVGDQRFYFVHSYGVHRDLGFAVGGAAWCEHGGDRFVAAVEWGKLWTAQFHPEKSGAAGAAVLRNWLAFIACDTSVGGSRLGLATPV